jgi:mono/diheme cytochrome c family protein
MNLCSARLAALGALCLLVIGGCETSPNAAFPTASAVAAHAGVAQSADIATLERGRKIYTTSCTECHVARPIANYSVARWQHYVGIMAPRAGLQSSDRAALEAYVVAARQSLPPGSASGSP